MQVAHARLLHPGNNRPVPSREREPRRQHGRAAARRSQRTAREGSQLAVAARRALLRAGLAWGGESAARWPGEEKAGHGWPDRAKAAPPGEATLQGPARRDEQPHGGCSMSKRANRGRRRGCERPRRAHTPGGRSAGGTEGGRTRRERGEDSPGTAICRCAI